MATLAQLEAEPWWGREIVTSPMVGLGLQLRAAYGTGPASTGIKGNERHLNGGHRSQEWILNSRYVDPPGSRYTVQSGLSGDQPRVCAALDFTPGAWGTADNRIKMRVLTRRVIDAMKAGRCDELLEVFGTLDGATVTGYRNDLNVVVSSDNSHLDHLHLRFDRRYANDNAVMSKMAAILLEDDVSVADVRTAIAEMFDEAAQRSTPTGRALANDLYAILNAAPVDPELAARLDAILAAALDDSDTTVVLPPEAIADLGEIKAAIAAVPDAVLDAEAARLAE